MKVLVFGITGMLGHALWQNLNQDFEVYGTIRGRKSDLVKEHSFFKIREENIFDEIDVLSKDAVNKVIEEVRPDVIINCIGIIKQLKEANDPILSISINSLYPHILAERCKKLKIRLIHISTDCVFSGKKGMYVEGDLPDPEDLYGRTKLLGELNEDNCLTIRTSLIGRELKGRLSLLEWFLAQKGPIKGYRKAVFSGLATRAFAIIVREIIIKHPLLSGIYHVASEPINKYELLLRLKDAYQKDIEIIPDETVVLDRSLSPHKFKKETSINVPSWNEMMSALEKEGMR